MLRYRAVDPDGDRDLLLDAHCEAGGDRRVSYREYQARWLASGQSATFLAAVVHSLQDPRTMVEMVEDGDGRAVVYLRVTFTNARGYGRVLADYGSRPDGGDKASGGE